MRFEGDLAALFLHTAFGGVCRRGGGDCGQRGGEEREWAADKHSSHHKIAPYGVALNDKPPLC